MYTLSTHIELPIAHRLPGAYSGLCVGNVSRDEKDVFPKDDFGMVHGHSYHITFKVSTNKMNDDYMVIDFKAIKKIIHEEMDKYENALILKKGDALLEYYKQNPEEGLKIFKWNQAPTAEYMSYLWWTVFDKKFKEKGIDVEKLEITVEETSHNSVSYTN